ncbi:MAG TPA: FecR family protein [Polyangiaceae bacterium]|nr:FecR family protein [Polyangiaceae bacterium]
MSAPRYAWLASRLFVREGEPEGPSPSAEERARAIHAVSEALSERARRRRLGRVAQWASACAAAVAVVAATAGVTRHVLRRDVPVAVAASPARSIQIVAHPIGSGASVVVSGAPAPLADGRQLAEGSHLVTPPNGQATLAFSTGTSVMLGEGTDLTINGDGAMQQLHLAGGWVGLHVAKLGVGQRFLVTTSDSEVEVRGTQFRVSIAHPDATCGGGTPTRVAVTEGVVTVRHGGVESRVAAGEQWPAGCAEGEVRMAQSWTAVTSAKAATAAPTVVASTLAERNDLWEQIVTAKQQGSLGSALSLCDRFVAKYPSGPLSEDARVEHMRLLRTLAPGRAPVAARQYMTSYPNGFARGEAEAIVAGTP